ncbi:MAG TPA: transporter substrate-binding domain-containing protein, partial [Acidimicrobiales bacterium]|nr:transporter substrate-binding domain-containing protein [Acidimicrobiales bacterium]
MTRGRLGRVLRLVAAVAVLAMVAAGCGDDDEESTGEEATGIRTIRSGTLTVCSDLPYPPFEFEEGGRTVGIDLDLMTAIAQDLGLQMAVQDTDFDGIFAALAANQCDVIASSVSITDERKQNNEFTQGYYEIQQSLLVRKADAERYKALEALNGRTVGVQSETTGEEYAQAQAPRAGFTVTSFTGADEAVTALKAGQVDGVLQDYPVNAYNAEKD